MAVIYYLFIIESYKNRQKEINKKQHI